ncbi:MAG: hypothetical protein ACRDZ4_21215 [Egibacteraceae bacterium]
MRGGGAPAASAGRLVDRPAGGNPVHGLADWEHDEILALFNEWAEVDRSHRKLAHHGSYLHRVRVSPSSVRRVLAAGGLTLRRPKRAGSSQRRPFPAWVTYDKNSIWIYDTTHFAWLRRHRRHSGHGPGDPQMAGHDHLRRADLHPSPGRVHRRAPGRGLLDEALARGEKWVDLSADDERRPILLAVSDNGDADDVGIHPGIHGDVRDRGSTSDALERRPTKPGPRRCSATSRASGRT